MLNTHNDCGKHWNGYHGSPDKINIDTIMEVKTKYDAHE